MEPLARIDLLNLEDTTLAPTHSVDGMHAKAAIRNQPRHHQLSHWPLPRKHPMAGRLGSARCIFCNGLNSHTSRPWRKSAGDNFGSAPRPSGDRCLVTHERSSLLRACWRLSALSRGAAFPEHYLIIRRTFALGAC